MTKPRPHPCGASSGGKAAIRRRRGCQAQSSRPSDGAKRRREARFWASFPAGGANGEGKKGTRTQAIRPGRPGTLGWSAAVALHYQLGPLEVSAAPRSLLRERAVALSTRLVRERAGH